jgi:hypothetical protein
VQHPSIRDAERSLAAGIEPSFVVAGRGAASTM